MEEHALVLQQDELEGAPAAEQLASEMSTEAAKLGKVLTGGAGFVEFMGAASSTAVHQDAGLRRSANCGAVCAS